MHPRERVAVYVIRKISGSPELLVFDHRDAPEAGTQVPAGGVTHGESLAEAALREVREEAGLAELSDLRVLGEQLRPHPHTGQMRHTTFIAVRSTETRNSWQHVVSAPESDDDRMVFNCYWIELERVDNMLVEEQREYIPQLLHTL